MIIISSIKTIEVRLKNLEKKATPKKFELKITLLDENDKIFWVIHNIYDGKNIRKIKER